jgi:hypothetical protein
MFKISTKQARAFGLALSIVDIVAFCEANRKEYELFLQHENEANKKKGAENGANINRR